MSRIRIALVATGVLALVGGGTALAEQSRSAGPRPAMHDARGFGRARFPGLDVVTSYLEISNSDLLAQLRQGKTLAQIANGTTGKSASGLIAALVADAKQRFGSHVPSDLEQRITDLVNGVHTNGRPRPGGPPFGPRHGFYPRGGSSN